MVMPIFTLFDILREFSIVLYLNIEKAHDKNINIAMSKTGMYHIVNIPQKYSSGLVKLANIMKEAARVAEVFIP